MREIVHGIDAPGVPSSVMLGKLDAIHEWISHVHVCVGHVNLGTQDHASFGMFPS